MVKKNRTKEMYCPTLNVFLSKDELSENYVFFNSKSGFAKILYHLKAAFIGITDSENHYNNL